MGVQESNINNLQFGARIDTRVQIKNTLAQFHEKKPQKYTIVVSNITKGKFIAKCTREYDEQKRVRKQRSSGIGPNHQSDLLVTRRPKGQFHNFSQMASIFFSW